MYEKLGQYLGKCGKPFIYAFMAPRVSCPQFQERISPVRQSGSKGLTKYRCWDKIFV